MTRPNLPPSEDLLLPAEYVGRDMRDTLSTALDILWMLAIPVGLGMALWPYIGGWAVMAAGALLCLITQLAAWMRSRPLPQVEPADEPLPPELPGPEDPGSLHVKGR